jgi:hypothetical protein
MAYSERHGAAEVEGAQVSRIPKRLDGLGFSVCGEIQHLEPNPSQERSPVPVSHDTRHPETTEHYQNGHFGTYANTSTLAHTGSISPPLRTPRIGQRESGRMEQYRLLGRQHQLRMGQSRREGEVDDIPTSRAGVPRDTHATRKSTVHESFRRPVSAVMPSARSRDDELGIEGLTIVMHLKGRDDLVIDADLGID